MNGLETVEKRQSYLAALTREREHVEARLAVAEEANDKDAVKLAKADLVSVDEQLRLVGELGKPPQKRAETRVVVSEKRA